jgi:hypothetical protein
MIKYILPAFLVIAVLCAFQTELYLKGTWQYSGGVYNGTSESPSKDYILQRKYDATHYNAMFIEKGVDPVSYESGDYILKKDTCLETQTFSSQPSKLLNVTVKYHYQIKNDTLTFIGILPNGTHVQEYWKKVR